MSKTNYYKVGGLGKTVTAIHCWKSGEVGSSYFFGQDPDAKDLVPGTVIQNAVEITEAEFKVLHTKWCSDYAMSNPDLIEEFNPKIKYTIMFGELIQIGYSELDTDQFIKNLPLMEKGGFRMLDEDGNTKAFINKNLAKHLSYFLEEM